MALQMKEITDPDVLKRLNAGDYEKSKEITDPDVLKRLNAGEFDRQENPTGDDIHDAVVRYGLKDPLAGILNLGSRGGTTMQNLGIALHNKLLGKNVPKVEDRKSVV